MDRVKQKSKKDRSQKHMDKDNSSPFITDVKSIKENLKIKEILRTVKMNSSMRVKAPRGSKVMNNKDFNDSADIFDEFIKDEGSHQHLHEPSPSATNTVIIGSADIDTGKKADYNISSELNANVTILNEQEDANSRNSSEESTKPNQTECAGKSSDSVESNYRTQPRDSASVTSDIKFPIDNTNIKNRDRKFSLDHTILTRREGFSQSELDLNSIGKSPLERKSSFFRKKMDSFFKNTTEIFKRQSMSSKPPVQRRGSMSMSLQSLNEKSCDYKPTLKNYQGSTISLQSSSTVGRSTSSLSTSQAAAGSEADSLTGSHPLLSASQPIIGDDTSDRVQNLNEMYEQESLLSARAFSMSSGLDSAHSTRRRKATNRSNRVTWVASEGLSHYFRRLIQDEKSKEIQVCQSYLDFTTIPENELCGPRLDCKGRRLSYQRAVSGEHPAATPPRHDNSLRRRPHIPENSEANYELTLLLNEFTRNGVPPLKGFTIADISDEAFAYLLWAEQSQNLEEFFYLKKFSSAEQARQAVIRELVSTEAVHIKHLRSIVEVFIAAAHALQDAGKLLDVDTERLFSNIPDVLNASLTFWDTSMFPMIAEAVKSDGPLNTELMSAGFSRFREIFAPYDKFVIQQTKALNYLRSLANNMEFMMYLTWCHSQKECNRLQLGDILVKPMQRLTKYSLILRRIITHTDIETERSSLIAMDNFSKNYVQDLNRAIRLREELEKLDELCNSIDSYEIDFKDDDMDKYFRMYSQLNLKAPMLNCLPTHSRSVIFEGDLRFKDKEKEIEVRAILLTDMLLITKKQSKNSVYLYKMIRPKYMIDKLVHFPKPHPRIPKDFVALTLVCVDDVGSSYTAFTLTDTQKERDPDTQNTLRTWDQKLREARLSYDLGVWYSKNPSRYLSDVEMDSSSDYTASSGRQSKQASDDGNIERAAHERVAAMMHLSMGVSTEHDCSQASMNTDSCDAAGDGSGASGMRTPGPSRRHPMHRTSTGGSSRQSRLSSFHQSTSAASHDEPQPGPSKPADMYPAGSSVEHVIPPRILDDNYSVITSITVNVVSESESETTVAQLSPLGPTGPPPTVQRAGSRSPLSGNTLRVHPQSGVLALVHSLPDLTVEPSPPRVAHSPSQQSASDKLYQSHQELLHRNRLAAHKQHYLTPDHRGTSYPPPSPSRASLKRGLAFSYSFKYPPLSKMGHVNSESPAEHGSPSTGHQAKGEIAAVTAPPPLRTSNLEKGEKKSKPFLGRHKSGKATTSDTAGPSTAGAAELQAGATELQAGATELQAGATELQAGAAESQAGAADSQAGAAGIQAEIRAGPSGTASTSGSIVSADISDVSISGNSGASGKVGSSGKASTTGKGKGRKGQSPARKNNKTD